MFKQLQVMKTQLKHNNRKKKIHWLAPRMLLTLDPRPKEGNQANITPDMSTHAVGMMQGGLPRRSQ